MLHGRSAQPSRTFSVIVVIVVALNIWFDYYHPRGIIVDVIFVVVLLIRFIGKSKPAS